MKLATVRTSLCGVFAEEVAEDLLVPQLWSPKFLMLEVVSCLLATCPQLFFSSALSLIILIILDRAAVYLLPRTCSQTSFLNVIMAASQTPRRSSLSGFQRRSYKPATPRWVRSDLVLGGTPALPGIQFRTQNQCDAPAAPVEGRNWSGELAALLLTLLSVPVHVTRFFRVDAESTKER